VRGYFSKKGTLESMLGTIVWPADNVLTTTDRIAHKRLRSALLPAFTFRALFEQEAVQQHHLGRLIQNLNSIAATGAVVNFTEYLSALIWDIIGDLSFGEPLLKDQKCKSTTPRKALNEYYADRSKADLKSLKPNFVGYHLC
jgi:cytochrome P450